MEDFLESHVCKLWCWISNENRGDAVTTNIIQIRQLIHGSFGSVLYLHTKHRGAEGWRAKHVRCEIP